MAELPPAVQAVVRQWPDGAYAVVEAGFIAHWTAESGMRASKRDWRAAWVKWLGGEHARVMAAARNGIDFGQVGRIVAGGAVARGPDGEAVTALLALQDGESEDARAIRAALLRDSGHRTYDGWLKPTHIEVESEALIVLAPSAFMRDWISEHFEGRIGLAARARLGFMPHVLVRVFKPPAVATA